MKSLKVTMRAEVTISVGDLVRFEVPEGYASDSREWRQFCRTYDEQEARILSIRRPTKRMREKYPVIRVEFLIDGQKELFSLDDWLVLVRKES